MAISFARCTAALASLALGIPTGFSGGTGWFWCRDASLAACGSRS
jgi:hypothetical protein